MFIIELTYKVPLNQIDAHLESHIEFLNKHYAAGNFIASGRKVPRDGGIILAVANNREEIANIISQDSFYINDLADYKIIEFAATKKAADIDSLIA